jgi:tetratricopeptide (TPR) repeat protein
VLLLLDNAEHGLDYAPSLDSDPWRWAAPLPFAAIAGLAAAGLAAFGIRRTGGPLTWSAVVACAAMPVVFYASSRYRLPAAVLLSVPAGCGVASLLDRSAAPPRRRLFALAAGVAVAVVSFTVPAADLTCAETAGALSNRAAAYRQAGELEAAERDARRAIETDPSLVAPRFNLATILDAKGDTKGAEAAYAAALDLDPASADAAGNLAALMVRRGAPRDAIPILERALLVRPAHEACRTNLVVALLAAGDAAGARRAAEAAARAGVKLDAGLLRELR